MTVRAVLLLLVAPALAGAWGWQGHKLITELAIERLPAQVRAVYAPLMPQLLDGCVEPDKRVRTDPREQPKHYLNVECLDPGYVALLEREHPGRGHKKRKRRKSPGEAPPPAPSGADEPGTPPLQKQYFAGRMPLPRARVDELFARLPATLHAFHALPPGLQREVGAVVYQPAEYHAELVAAFRAGDPARIAGVTGFLAHYVGDLHVPLHTTIDHEGAYHGSPRTGKGVNGNVHSRFESGFVGYLGPALRSLAARQVGPAAAVAPAAITARAIREARDAYGRSPEVLAIDSATMRFHSGRTVQWKRFYAQFEPRMAPLAARQIALSAQMLADLVLSAWLEAKRT